MKKGLTLLLVGAMLCGLVACTPTDTAAPGTTTTAAATTAPSREPTGGNSQYDLNPLTGDYTLAKGSGTRPVAIMVTNEPGIIGNQYGIDKADFYMETESEGSVPRIMAVFSNASRIPQKFGPIRSGRTPFIATANSLGATYVFSGATAYVLNVVHSTPNFDHITNTDSTTLWRDDYLTAHANVSWNNLITGGEKIAAYMLKNGISNTAIKPSPLSFGDKKGDRAATTVQLKSTASTTVTFVYDPETGLYGKNNGKIGSCKPQKSLEGNQIQVSNVLILYAEKYVEQRDNRYTWYNFRTGEGSGYLISNGTAREIKFSRTADSLTLMEADGSKIQLATGKTYMFLTDDTLREDLILQ